MLNTTNLQKDTKKTVKQWNLIRFRTEKGYTQPDMAKHLKMSVSTYSYKENGHRDFTGTEMFAISNLLDKSIGEIFLP